MTSIARTIAVTAAVVVAVVGCGGDGGESASLPLVDEIGPAIAAVDDELGGPQEYFEVNATPQLVNLFVAVDDGATVIPYVYLDGELQEPAPAGPVQSGTAFTGTDVEVDAAVFDRIGDELDDPTITQVVVTATEAGTPRLEVLVASERGGVLAVAVTPDGEILAVDPL